MITSFVRLATRCFPSAFPVAMLACSSSVVPAQHLDVVLERGGVQSRAVVSLPARDAKAAHSPGDDSCDFFSGNCGGDRPTEGTVVSGDAPIARVQLTTLEDGSDGVYDVVLSLPAMDSEKYTGRVPACRVYEAQLGTTQPCFFTMEAVRITLARR